MKPLSLSLACFVCGLLASGSVLAQPAPQKPSADKPSPAPDALTPAEEAEREAHRERMKRLAQSLDVFPDVEARRPVAVLPQPILRYVDFTRKQHDSAIWVWGTGIGRPSAIGAIEYYPDRPQGPQWLYELVSVSDHRIKVKHASGLDWMATAQGLKLEPLPNSPAPATRLELRLSQMRQLLRRFAAIENSTQNGRIQLRLVSQPIYRYKDPQEGILDGAIFSFANGLNPEILLLLEAHHEEPDAWYYGVARMTGEAASLTFEDKEVWSCQLAEPPATRESYLNGWIPAAALDKGTK